MMQCACSITDDGCANLQGVCCNFVGEADATALLLQVYDHARLVILYILHRELQLLRTVALQRPKHLCKQDICKSWTHLVAAGRL